MHMQGRVLGWGQRCCRSRGSDAADQGDGVLSHDMGWTSTTLALPVGPTCGRGQGKKAAAGSALSSVESGSNKLKKSQVRRRHQQAVRCRSVRSWAPRPGSHPRGCFPRVACKPRRCPMLARKQGALRQQPVPQKDALHAMCQLPVLARQAARDTMPVGLPPQEPGRGPLCAQSWAGCAARAQPGETSRGMSQGLPPLARSAPAEQRRCRCDSVAAAAAWHLQEVLPCLGSCEAGVPARPDLQQPR